MFIIIFIVKVNFKLQLKSLWAFQLWPVGSKAATMTVRLMLWRLFDYPLISWYSNDAVIWRVTSTACTNIQPEARVVFHWCFYSSPAFAAIWVDLIQAAWLYRFAFEVSRRCITCCIFTESNSDKFLSLCQLSFCISNTGVTVTWRDRIRSFK